MKGFAVLLLCLIAAVQGRSTRLQVVDDYNPWVVHLRMAVRTSGYLDTAVGALIGDNWVLTTASAVHEATFIWVRLNANADVFQPELVIETSTVRLHEDWNPFTGANNIAVINTNYNIETTNTISPVALPSALSIADGTATYCAFGEKDRNTPGEKLSCWDVVIVEYDNSVIYAVGDDVSVSEYDTGAPLVSDGRVIGLLARSEFGPWGRLVFIRTSSQVSWIVGMTGIPN